MLFHNAEFCFPQGLAYSSISRRPARGENPLSGCRERAAPWESPPRTGKPQDHLRATKKPRTGVRAQPQQLPKAF